MTDLLDAPALEHLRAIRAELVRLAAAVDLELARVAAVPEAKHGPGALAPGALVALARIHSRLRALAES